MGTKMWERAPDFLKESVVKRDDLKNKDYRKIGITLDDLKEVYESLKKKQAEEIILSGYYSDSPQQDPRSKDFSMFQ